MSGAVLRRARVVRIVRAALTLLLLGGYLVAPQEIAFAGEKSDRVVIDLPEPRRSGEMAVEQALASRRSIRSFAQTPLRIAAVGQLLWAAQGINDSRGLRTAPSAGALYPLEIHLVAGTVTDLAPGVYRYEPAPHRLVRTEPGDRRAQVARAASGQAWIAEAPAVLVLTGVHARSARKYGDRAWRYVHMEVGHAAQNVYLQAVALGLGTTMVGAFQDEHVARALGLPAEERPLGLLPLGRPR